MTDYTKLIESLRILGYFANDMQARSVAKEAADAIQAMQAENASLKQIAELNAQIAIDLKAERDQLQAENERLKSIPMKYKRMEFNAQLQEENAVLQAKLDELSKQKPVGVVALYPDVVDWTGEEPPIGANLYAAPKALAPRFTECRIELVGAIHTLASHYENRLGRLDPEDRKLAEGDIAHAMATSAKWNWNGNGIGGTP